MNFQTLRLVNFRNYKKAEIRLFPNSLIVGKNGVGKTNLLEALFLISTGKSFRGARNYSLVRKGESEGVVCVEVGGKKNENLRIHIRQTTNDRVVHKQAYVNNKRKSSIDLLGRIPTVIFAPEQLAIIRESPRLRRNFLDLLIAQTNSIYAKELFRLSRVLKSRNKLLFEIRETKAKTDELEFWNQELVELGTRVTLNRIKVIKDFNKRIRAFYQKISRTHDLLELAYESSVTGKINEALDSERFKELFFKKLKGKLSLEVSLGQSLVGPHRDDPLILFNQQPISEFGSRGEARSALIALKFAEFDYLKSHHQTNPIFLLDDVFSELDQHRTGFLLENLPKATQIIFTATTTPKFLKNSQFKVIDLEKCLKK